MGYQTPNIDRIAAKASRFTDYYAQQSCTAGRAAFIGGIVPVRTGMTKVGLPAPRKAGRRPTSTIATPAQGARAMPPASSARTILAIATSICRPCTASTNISAAFTT